MAGLPSKVHHHETETVTYSDLLEFWIDKDYDHYVYGSGYHYKYDDDHDCYIVTVKNVPSKLLTSCDDEELCDYYGLPSEALVYTNREFI